MLNLGPLQRKRLGGNSSTPIWYILGWLLKYVEWASRSYHYVVAQQMVRRLIDGLFL
jgi:hypothetical protein